jgi:uncharacterized protein (DUF2384 family)
MTEKQALQILEETDSALATAAADAVREIDSVQAVLAEHEAALLEFRRSTRGILAAHEARAFIEDFDKLISPPGQIAMNGATAAQERAKFFRFQRDRLAVDARELFIGSNGERLASAIQVIVSTRTKTRDAWRAKMADEIQKLERRQLLNEPLTVDESRRLDTLDRTLAAQDSIFGSANNALLKFRAQPTSEYYNEARMFAGQIDYEGTP